jgi:hypothetical protein
MTYPANKYHQNRMVRTRESHRQMIFYNQKQGEIVSGMMFNNVQHMVLTNSLIHKQLTISAGKRISGIEYIIMLKAAYRNIAHYNARCVVNIAVDD